MTGDLARRRAAAWVAGVVGLGGMLGATIGPAAAASKPGAPSIGVATGGVASVSVSFSPPASNGGSAITSYAARCTSSNGGAAGVVSKSGSPIVVSPLTNGKTYTCTVTATNAAGTGAASAPSNAAIPATVPRAPTQVTAAVRNVSLKVSFVAPSNNGGSAVTGYAASCSSSNGGASGSASGAGSPLIVNGLTNGRTYTCAVTASNAVGAGGASAASNIAVPNVTVPDPPTITNAIAGNTAISLTFSPPANNGGSGITGYTASCSSSNGGASASASSGVSPITVNGVTNGKTYSCVVTATSALGTGAPSVPTGPLFPKTVPGAPTIGSATSRNASLSVSFAPPASDGGSPVTGYAATCTSSNGGASGSASGSGSPIIVSGLTNGRQYTCTATATNALGRSGPSTRSNTAVPAVTAPEPPTITGTTGGNTALAVRFSPPADNGGSAITSYTASCTSPTGGAAGSATAAGSPITVNGLTNGHYYLCTVRATNAIGTSAPSAASQPTFVATVPGAPTIGAVSSRNASLRVAFTAPASDGGSVILRYRASCASSNGGTPGSAVGSGSPIIVTGLTNGRVYTCTATATNALGTSPSSGASNLAVPAVTVPDPPVILGATGRNGSVTLNFTAPADSGGSAITGYLAWCTSPNGGTPGSATGVASPIVVSPLTNGATYSCRMAAMSGIGTSVFSDPVDVLVVTVPDAPTLSVVFVNNGSLLVAFSGPADDGGSPVTGYAAYCASSDGGIGRRKAGAKSPITVAGLTNGKHYTCSVTASNAAGTSGASAASRSAIVGAPKAPVSVVAAPNPTTTSTGSVTVRYKARSDNGAEIIRYVVYCASYDGGVVRGAAHTGSDAAPVTVSKMTTGRTYSCWVMADNERGRGLPSRLTKPFVVGVTAISPGRAASTRR